MSPIRKIETVDFDEDQASRLGGYGANLVEQFRLMEAKLTQDSMQCILF